ncbi:MAG: nuclear transport factor 2 family protein, partial [Polyangiaceae bacterium]|nr:nuclear transport factor 2 family protein [Polyangiaceae bacterium]
MLTALSMPDDQSKSRTTAQRDELLSVAAASPREAGARNRAAWYALFAEGASVEDPVGTPACRKGARTAGLLGNADELLAFFDAFIAGNDVRFEVHQDVVVGMTVARDVTIHTRVPPGFISSVRAHLLYELVESG